VLLTRAAVQLDLPACFFVACEHAIAGHGKNRKAIDGNVERKDIGNFVSDPAAVAGDGPQTRARVSPAEVKHRLRSLITEIAKIPSERIVDSATVDDDLAMESVMFVELLVALEDEYHIEIDPVNVLELNEFGLIADYVHQQIAAATGLRPASL